MISYSTHTAIDQYLTNFHASVQPTTKHKNPMVRPRFTAPFPKADFKGKTTSAVPLTLTNPIEVSLLQGGKWIGIGKLEQVTLDEVQIKTDIDFAEDNYLEIHLQLPGCREKHRLWGRIVQSTEQGVVVLMDVLHPATLAGLRALKNINQQS